MLRTQLSLLAISFFGVVTVSHANITCFASFNNLKNQKKWESEIPLTHDIGKTKIYDIDDSRFINYSVSVNKQRMAKIDGLYDIILTIVFPNYSTDSTAVTTEFNSSEKVPYLLYMEKNLKQYKIKCGK